MSIEVKIGEPQEIQNEDNKQLGVKAIVSEDADILISNPDHRNFTETGSKIPRGTIIFGKFANIQGLRRGKPFVYRLFITNDNKIIYLNKIQQMKTTEVTLGADNSQTATVVDIESGKKNFTKFTIGGALLGASAAWYYAKKMKNMESKKVNMFLLGGAVLGFFAGKYVEKRKPVLVKPSK